MKKIMILLISFTIVSLNLLAQNDKYLFIGIYDTEKKGICSNKTCEKIIMNDKAACDLKYLEFKETHKNDESFSTIKVCVSNSQCAIIYCYNTKRSGWDCTPKVYSYKTGTTIKSCEDQLAADVTKTPSNYVTQPSIVFYWQEGKEVIQK